MRHHYKMNLIFATSEPIAECDLQTSFAIAEAIRAALNVKELDLSSTQLIYDRASAEESASLSWTGLLAFREDE